MRRRHFIAINGWMRFHDVIPENSCRDPVPFFVRWTCMACVGVWKLNIVVAHDLSVYLSVVFFGILAHPHPLHDFPIHCIIFEAVAVFQKDSTVDCVFPPLPTWLQGV